MRANGMEIRVMANNECVCSTLDDKDRRRCTARGHGSEWERATHFVAWPTKTGASGAYRCRVHAMEFCERRGVAFLSLKKTA